MKKPRITGTTFLGSTFLYNGESKIPPVVYMVTSVQENECTRPEGLKREPPSPRCWGWYPTLKEAKKSVKMNSGDMAECCYYSHVVIEKVPAGICSIGVNDLEDSETWYKWHVDPKDPNRFRGKWLRCDKPVWSKGIIGWSIG